MMKAILLRLNCIRKPNNGQSYAFDPLTDANLVLGQ